MKTKIKICGIRSLEEVVALKDFPIDYLGMIFSHSPRQIDEVLAKKIFEQIKLQQKKAVGVFVNEPLPNIRQTIKNIPFDVVQLHGQEQPHYILELKETNQSIDVWKSFSVLPQATHLPSFTKYKNIIEYPLFDTKGKQAGGNGKAFSWQALKQLPPYSYILAGGIGVKNFITAVSFQPAIVDINSQVETNERKDAKKIATLFEAFTNEKEKIS